MSPKTASSKNILYVVDTFWGVAWYRCHTPGVALMRDGHEAVMTSEVTAEQVQEADVFVALRLYQPWIVNAMRHLNSMGKMTVLDIDDDYWAMHPDNPAYSGWNAERLGGLESVIREARLVTTTTKELADILKPMNRNITVLPNMLPNEHWPKERTPARDSKPLVLGWMGSTGHWPDIRMVAPVLTQLLDEFDFLEVHLAGADPYWLPQHPRVHYPECVQVEQLAELMSGFDIAIAPLLDTRFNRCKSDLKFLEYGALGLPVVASHVAPYAQSIKNDVNGYLAKNPKDWLRRLRALILDRDLRERIGAQARVFAESRMIDANIWRWEKAYGIGE